MKSRLLGTPVAHYRSLDARARHERPAILTPRHPDAPALTLGNNRTVRLRAANASKTMKSSLSNGKSHVWRCSLSSEA